MVYRIYYPGIIGMSMTSLIYFYDIYQKWQDREKKHISYLLRATKVAPTRKFQAYEVSLLTLD